MFAFKYLFIFQVLFALTLSIDIDKVHQDLGVLTNEICEGHASKTELKLTGNGIKVIQDGALNQCTEVLKIALELNELKTLKSGTFLNKAKLKNLNLRNNKLEFIDEDVFTGLISLEDLDLKCNRLVLFTPKMVTGLNNLKYLHLDSNRLLDLDVNEMIPLIPNIYFLTFNANYIACTRFLEIMKPFNNTEIRTADLHCPALRHPTMIDAKLKGDIEEVFFCIPDDKYNDVVMEIQPLIDGWKAKHI